MAYSVDYLNLVVFIPRSELTEIIPDVQYQLDVISLWENIHDIQDSFPAMAFPPIMQGLPPETFSPRGVVIDPDNAGWRIEIEDGSYEVEIINGNTDLASRRVPNNVSITSRTLTGASPQEIFDFFDQEGGLTTGECIHVEVHDVEWVRPQALEAHIVSPEFFAELRDEDLTACLDNVITIELIELDLALEALCHC